MDQGAILIDEEAVSDTRVHPRYNLLVTLEAQLAGQPAIVSNVSEQGLGLRHAAQIRVGSIVPIRIQAPENDSATHIRCKVAWSRLSRTADARRRNFYDSGFRILDDTPAVAGLMDKIIRAYGIKDDQSLEAKRLMLETRARLREAAMEATDTTTPVIPSITPEQMLLIRDVQEILATDPDASGRWRERAREAITRLGITDSDSASSARRRDLLVVWEYLGGSLDPEILSIFLDDNGEA
jgi:hypothetical protein